RRRETAAADREWRRRRFAKYWLGDEVGPVLAQDAVQSRHDHRVQAWAGVVEHSEQSLVRRDRLTVWPVSGQHVVRVGDGDDPRLDRDLNRSQAVRVARAVHPLVVIEDAEHLAGDAACAPYDRDP